MTKAKFSLSTGGFYLTKVFSTFPDDALDIPNVLVDKFLNGEINGFNVLNGKVVENQPLEITNEQKIEELKCKLNKMELEAIMPRGAREAWIVLCLQQGELAGLTEPQLYAANPFYKGLKDTNAIATDLRAQIKALV